LPRLPLRRTEVKTKVVHPWEAPVLYDRVGMALWLLTRQGGIEITRLVQHIILLQIILKSYMHCSILNIR